MSLAECSELDLSPLALLHLSAQRALFQELRETLRDRAALSYLQRVVCIAAKLHYALWWKCVAAQNVVLVQVFP